MGGVRGWGAAGNERRLGWLKAQGSSPSSCNLWQNNSLVFFIVDSVCGGGRGRTKERLPEDEEGHKYSLDQA